MDRKIWFSPLAFATLHKEPKPNHQREGELWGLETEQCTAITPRLPPQTRAFLTGGPPQISICCPSWFVW